MQLNVVTDVVIGLVVLFWIVATSSSFVVEAISSYVNLRGKALDMFVREMLQGSDASAQARRALSRLWMWSPSLAPRERPQTGGAVTASPSALDIADHPLIRQLAKPQGSMRGADTPPSYIPSDLFVKALVDRLRQNFAALLSLCEIVAALREHLPGAVMPGKASSLRDPASTLSVTDLQPILERILAVPTGPNDLAMLLTRLPPDGAPARVLRVLQSHLNASPSPRGQTIVGQAWPEITAVLESRTLGVADLQAIVASGRIPAPLAAALKPLLDAANHDIEAFRNGLASWYDSVMDRATGWFRGYTQWLLGVVALLIACALNLDAIYIGERLAADHEARDAALRVGQTIVEQGEGARALPQKFLFRERFMDGTWSAPLADGPDLSAAAESLAPQVQAMLLTSARFVEPVAAWQAAGLSIMRRCPKGVGATPCRADDLKEQWKDQVKARQALSVELCRPVDAAGKPSVPQTAAAEKRCAVLKASLTAESGDAAKVLETMWSSELVTWERTLALAAWNLRASVAAPPEERAQKARAFRDAMRTAIDAVTKELAASDDLLARLPAVGSPVKAYDRWTAPELSPLEALARIVLSLLGWFVTALMASLGAPMWFDLLNKLVNRRISGPKPETAAGAAT